MNVDLFYALKALCYIDAQVIVTFSVTKEEIARAGELAAKFPVLDRPGVQGFKDATAMFKKGIEPPLDLMTYVEAMRRAYT